MILITITTALLVLLSIILIIAIPVTLAVPGEWQNSKEIIDKGIQTWISLVLCIATVDGLVSTVKI